jgi:lysophospholipase L1-like esterase
MLKKKWPENRTIAIACHGHSVPSGYFKTPVIKPFSSYPHLLHRAIKARFPFAAINVIVTAIGGETSEHGAERFGKDVLAVRPDVITIDYGLNDRNIGLENAKKAWISMIELAKTKNIKILLMTPTPDTAYQADDQEQSLQQHAGQIRALAAKFKVGLVDSLSVFDKQIKNGILLKSLLSHINHPNAKGHKLVVNELIKWFPE